MGNALPSEALDATDRLLIDRLQEGLPLTHAPFAPVAAEAGIPDTEVIARIAHLREIGAIARFGPLLDPTAMVGAFCLCALEVPEARFGAVMSLVNAHPEVAHSHQRQHRLNMWFVLACERPEEIRQVAAGIERETGLTVRLFPKVKEFRIGFQVKA